VVCLLTGSSGKPYYVHVATERVSLRRPMLEAASREQLSDTSTTTGTSSPKGNASTFGSAPAPGEFTSPPPPYAGHRPQRPAAGRSAASTASSSAARASPQAGSSSLPDLGPLRTSPTVYSSSPRSSRTARRSSSTAASPEEGQRERQFHGLGSPSSPGIVTAAALGGLPTTQAGPSTSSARPSLIHPSSIRSPSNDSVSYVSSPGCNQDDEDSLDDGASVFSFDTDYAAETIRAEGRGASAPSPPAAGLRQSASASTSSGFKPTVRAGNRYHPRRNSTASSNTRPTTFGASSDALQAELAILRGQRLAELERLAYLQTKNRHLEAELRCHRASEGLHTSMASGPVGTGTGTGTRHRVGAARFEMLQQRLAEADSRSSMFGDGGEAFEPGIIRDLAHLSVEDFLSLERELGLWGPMEPSVPTWPPNFATSLAEQYLGGRASYAPYGRPRRYSDVEVSMGSPSTAGLYERRWPAAAMGSYQSHGAGHSFTPVLDDEAMFRISPAFDDATDAGRRVRFH